MASFSEAKFSSLLPKFHKEFCLYLSGFRHSEGWVPVNTDSLNLVLSVFPLCDKLDGIFLPLPEPQISQKKEKKTLLEPKPNKGHATPAVGLNPLLCVKLHKSQGGIIKTVAEVQ